MDQRTFFTVIWFNSLVLYLPLSMIIVYKRPALWQLLLSIFLGIIVGILDTKTDEVQFPALLLLVFGFFMGFVQPVRAWKWAFFLAPGYLYSRLGLLSSITHRKELSGKVWDLCLLLYRHSSGSIQALQFIGLRLVVISLQHRHILKRYRQHYKHQLTEQNEQPRYTDKH